MMQSQLYASSNSLIRIVRVRCFSALIIALCGCASTNPLTADFNKHASFPLCSAILNLPDVTANSEARKRFEDKLVEVGVFNASAANTKTTIYNVSPQHRGAVRTLYPGVQHLPAIGRVCFGQFKSVGLDRTIATGYKRAKMFFRYEVVLEPWARSFYSYMHLPRAGVATVEMAQTSSSEHPLAIGPTRAPDIDFRDIIYPPDGRSWYPNGMPGANLHNWRMRQIHLNI